MKKTILLPLLFFSFIILLSSTSKPGEKGIYISFYKEKITGFEEKQKDLLAFIKNADSISGEKIDIILNKIKTNRFALKETDFWTRYLDPINYKKINGPLPVEWETEVFEKYEAPYKREGAGLTLAELYLEEKKINKDSLYSLIKTSIEATNSFLADSITRNLSSHHHFFLANRLFLLNMAAIYTTGFECPDTASIIPELLHTLENTRTIYTAFEQDFPGYKINAAYYGLYDSMILFVKKQPVSYTLFNHFAFIQQYITPLYQLNRQMILDYNVRTTNFNDYSLNKFASSIFDKQLYRGQNQKGVYIGIDDEKQLEELKSIGKLLFFDPIFSANNKRSCASCHKPNQFFTDTALTTSLQFDQSHFLTRNTPSLLNATQNHLMMLDGKHINLENQTKDVIANPLEMNSSEDEVLKKILSCDEYKTVFKKYLKSTPQYESVNIEHIASALMLYYSDLSSYSSPFDDAMNKKTTISSDAGNGFNLFMSKAKCGTCHFVPQFSGVKPPYIGSEFEVLGVPTDTLFKTLSPDRGRYGINPAKETNMAFRTSTIRNVAVTKPYMHNGVFKTLEEVINFYDNGGGIGKGLTVPNQTLSADSLKLTKREKTDLIAFINSLTEQVPLQTPPTQLPVSKNKLLNRRVVGGEY